MVELKVTATRIPTSYIIKIVLPVTLCAIVAYTGFFLKIGQLMPRLALSVLSFLILSTYMRVIVTSIPARSYLVWVEYWLTMQAVMVAFACCHHSACHYLNEKYSESKSNHLDIAMRICFPIAYFESYLWAEAIVSFGSVGGHFFNIITVGLLVLFFIVIFVAMERRSSARTEKSHYPGI